MKNEGQDPSQQSWLYILYFTLRAACVVSSTFLKRHKAFKHTMWMCILLWYYHLQTLTEWTRKRCWIFSRITTHMYTLVDNFLKTCKDTPKLRALDRVGWCDGVLLVSQRGLQYTTQISVSKSASLSAENWENKLSSLIIVQVGGLQLLLDRFDRNSQAYMMWHWD